MSFESFIAKHFLSKSRSPYSGSLVRIATVSIALGVLVMITAVSILRGFQGEIRQKVVGFGSHIVVHSFESSTLEASIPIATDRPEVERLRHAPGVKHLQFFAHKGGMVKTDEQIHGIILKGIDANADTTFFSNYLVAGKLPDFTTPLSPLAKGESPLHSQFSPLAKGESPQGEGVHKPPVSNEVLISQTIADKLEVGVGDKLRTYFWGEGTYRARAFEVCGIYKTDLTDFDDHYIVGDLRQVQRLNGWDSNMVEGYEILVTDLGHQAFSSRLEATAENLLTLISYDLTLTTVVQQNPALFSWLSLLDSNIVLIITIMILVCTVAILSALLIMIFEKTSTIGLLKALGATNTSVRRIFLIKSSQIILKGILIGEAVALLICGLQKHFQFIRLDSASYSMDAVPIDLNPWIFILVAVGTLAVTLLTLLLPTAYISNIHPAKTIRFN